jgi:hypothetical protein
MLKLYTGTAKSFQGNRTRFKPNTNTSLSDQMLTWHHEVELLNEAKAEAKEKRKHSNNKVKLRRELVGLGVTFDAAGNPVLPMMD